MRNIIAFIAFTFLCCATSYAQNYYHTFSGEIKLENLTVSKEYIGPVATRSALPNFYTSSSFKHMQTRSRHIAIDDIPSAQLVFSTLYPTGASEDGSLSIAGSITASIEYPAGTFNQVTFSGAVTGTLPTGDNLLSDMVSLSTPIPAGAEFWVRNYVVFSSANIIYFNDGLNWLLEAESGEQCEHSASSLTDKTMSGSLTDNAFQGIHYRPTAILGWTDKPTFFLMGDSKTRSSGQGGNVDLNYTIDGMIGEVARKLGKSFAYINAAVSGDSYFNITGAAGYTKRASLARYCTHIIDNYGINDLGVSGTLSVSTFNNYINELKVIEGIWGKPYYHGTLTPRATSTDQYSTIDNQTPVASTSYRTGFNDALRNGEVDVSGYIELADQIESGRNSGYWTISTGRTVSGVSTTNASANITAGSSVFLPSDVGRSICFNGSACGYIRTVSSGTAAVLQRTFSATLSNVDARIGFATTDGIHASLDGDMAIYNSNAFSIFDGLVR